VLTTTPDALQRLRERSECCCVECGEPWHRRLCRELARQREFNRSLFGRDSGEDPGSGA